LPDRPALQRERGGVDDRLVAEVQRAQARLPVERQQPTARADDADAQAVALGEGEGLTEKRAQRVRLADRVSGHEQHAALDAVAEEGAAVAREEVAQVATQLEEGEGVGTVGADEGSGHAALVPRGGPDRRGGGAEEVVCDDEEARQAEQPRADGEPRDAGAERERAVLPEEERGRL